METETISFLKSFIRKLTLGRIEIVTFGWWPAGMKGKYGLTIYWNDVREMDE